MLPSGSAFETLSITYERYYVNTNRKEFDTTLNQDQPAYPRSLALAMHCSKYGFKKLLKSSIHSSWIININLQVGWFPHV